MGRKAKKAKKVSQSHHPRRVTELDKTIGMRLRARRLEMKISQQELGDALGISFQQVQKYEKGVNRIGSSRLIELANAMKCSMAYFLPDTNGKQPATSRFAEFLATKDGVEINEAMMKLNEAHRRGVIELARTLARVYGD
jgi:transcriptional regulator with XRE-family HTH domain